MSRFLFHFSTMKYRDDEFLKEFGLNFRKIRESKDLSQEAVAIKANVPRSQIGRLERGEINTTISSLRLFSKILNVEITTLFDF